MVELAGDCHRRFHTGCWNHLLYELTTSSACDFAHKSVRVISSGIPSPGLVVGRPGLEIHLAPAIRLPRTPQSLRLD